MLVDKLINDIQTRANNLATRIDMEVIAQNSVIGPLSSASLAHSIEELGFDLPYLLVSVLQKVGNGGFGPGYGLLGLKGGFRDDVGHMAVDLYTIFYGSNGQPMGWPKGMLPICHWGCAIYTCIDCMSPNANMVLWDPNEWDEGTPAKMHLKSLDTSLEEWLSAWTKGDDLWVKMYPNQ